MPAFMRKIDLSRLAQVAPSTVTKACRAELREAMAPDGKRLRADHPLVKAYIAGGGLPRPGRPRPRQESSPRPAQAATIDPDPAGDPPSPPDALALVADLAAQPTQEIAGTLRKLHTRQYLADLQQDAAGQLPPDLEELGELTLREAVDRFGTFQAMNAVVKSLRDFAVMKDKEAVSAKRRGLLVERELVITTLLPLVELAFGRLVSEAPGALAEQVIARVLHAGGEGDLSLEVEEMIRRENSGILTGCRNTVVAALQEHLGYEGAA